METDAPTVLGLEFSLMRFDAFSVFAALLVMMNYQVSSSADALYETKTPQGWCSSILLN